MKQNQRPCPKCSAPMHRQSKCCRSCHTAAIERPENYLTRDCAKCGKSFTFHKAHDRRYCSHHCSGSGSPSRKRQGLATSCHICNQPVYKTQSELRKGKGQFHFCSSECWYKHNTRENNYLWSGGQHERLTPEAIAWRKAVIKRDRKVCRRCLATKRLQAHHIKPFRSHPEERWDVANGLTLCEPCHRMVQGREMTVADLFAFMASVRLSLTLEEFLTDSAPAASL